MQTTVPKYTDLPEKLPGYRCSWDYFNSLPGKNGETGGDQLGTLNFLTNERRLEAARDLIKTGQAISLDLPVDYFRDVISAFGGRPEPVHKVTGKVPFSKDDTLSFNTQSSSQWDGFRHFSLIKTCQYYNGHRAEEFETSDVLGVHSWVEAGGISGRCVLIDFCTWAKRQGEDVDPNSGRPISLQETLAILQDQKVEIKPGDVLLFRTGWLKWYNETKKEERYTELCERNAPGQHKFIGLDQTPEFVEWLWNNQIAAVAGDQVAFERTPPREGSFGMLHEHVIAALGCPMGELFDTEQIAQTCLSRGKYDFFLASVPLRVTGGVATPSNAMAIL